MWWAILDSGTKIKWMLLTILIPEYLVGKAFNEWLLAQWGKILLADIALNLNDEVE
jgi:hypothetical protein